MHSSNNTIITVEGNYQSASQGRVICSDKRLMKIGSATYTDDLYFY